MTTRTVPPPSPRLLRALAVMANNSNKAGLYVARPEHGGYAVYRPENPGDMRIRANATSGNVELLINGVLSFSAATYHDVAGYVQKTYALSVARRRSLYEDYVKNNHA